VSVLNIMYCRVLTYEGL